MEKERKLVKVKWIKRKDGLHCIEDWKMNIPIAEFLRNRIREEKIKGRK